MKNHSFLSSLESAAKVLSKVEDNDVFEIRDNLTYFLYCNLEGNQERKRDSFKSINSKINRKYYTKLLEKITYQSVRM